MTQTSLTYSPFDVAEAGNASDRQDLLDTVLRHKNLFLTVLALTVLLLGALNSLWYASSPALKHNILLFRLTFDGAELGVYPNGTAFSAEDILNQFTLHKVYDSNNLGAYLPFEDWQGSLYINNENWKSLSLAAEYDEKLSQKTLTTAERDKIERTYREKMAGMRNLDFSLRQSVTDKVLTIPDELQRKTMHDILRMWADSAINTMNVLKYSMPIIDASALSLMDANASPSLLNFELLRNTLTRTKTSIDNISKLPGAHSIVSDQGGRITELYERTDNIINYRLLPMSDAYIADSHIEASDVAILASRIQSLLNQVEMKQKEIETYTSALGIYTQGVRDNLTKAPPSVLTQENGSKQVIHSIGDSFIDKLATLVAKPEDITYIQNFVTRISTAGVALGELQLSLNRYQHLLAKIEKQGGPAKSQKSSSVDPVAFRKMIEETGQIILELNEFYHKLAREVLGSAGRLYITRSDMVQKSSSTFNPKLAAAFSSGVLLVTLFGLLSYAVYSSRMTPSLPSDKRTAGGSDFSQAA